MRYKTCKTNGTQYPLDLPGEGAKAAAEMIAEA